MATGSRSLRPEVSGQAQAFNLNAERESSAIGPLRFRERRWIPWLMAFTDICVAQLTLVMGFVARYIAAPLLPRGITPANYRGIFVGLLAWPLANWFMGLYPGFGLSPVERLRRRVIGAGMMFAGLAMWDNLVLRGGWSRGIEVFGFVFALILSPLVEALVISVLVHYRCWGTPVVVLSSDNASSGIVGALKRQPELGLVPIAILEGRPEMWGRTVEGMPVPGPASLAEGLATRARTAIVAMPGLQRPQLASLIQTLPFPSVILVPDLHGVQTLWITPRDLGGALGLELRRNLLLKRNYYFKRFLDYALGVPLFLLSAPVVAALALWIKCVSPGAPALFAQEREGYRGSGIRMWKLRTMYPDAENLLELHLERNPELRDHWKQYYKLKHDPRVLPGVGSLLRRSSLDELPQLWNVIRGEMSLVGPRPFPGYHTSGFSGEFRELRQSVPPGLTGYWQISERSNANVALQEHLDTYYIRNWSVWLDIYILTQTLKAVIMARGAY